MKKILFIVGLLIGFQVAFSQSSPTFLPPRSSATTTVQDSRLRALLTFYYPHTHGLTLNGGLDTLGAVIYEDSSGHVWYRDTIPAGGHRWRMMLSFGDPTGGVSSFNTRTGAVTLTSGDVITALTYTPINPNGISSQYIAGDGSKVTFPTIPAQINITDAGLFQHSGTYPNYTFTGLTPTQQQVFTQGSTLTSNNFWITGANVLGMTGTAAFGLPTGSTSQRPSSPGAGYFRYNTDSSATETYNGSQWVKTGTGTGVTGVTSFNTRTGGVTLTSGDVITALTFTPYNATNPAGYISNITGKITAGANITLTGTGITGDPYVIVGTASGSTFNQDSIKHRFVDTGSTARNLYTLAWDSVNKKWILTAPGTGGGGTGTVTNFSFSNANGFTGLVTNSSTIPALTVGTSITGLLFGNGTAISNATISSPLTYSTGTLGIQTANTSQAGAISASDWNLFNGKQSTVSLTTTGTSGAATFISNTLNIPQYQGQITLTTTGTSGAATLIGNTLNIPQYAGTTYTFNNGLTNTTGTVQLGGSLLQNTTVGTAGFNLLITGLPSKATALGTDSVLIEDISGKIWKLPVPSGGGGSGTVTSFSAGTLSPLFTTSVATATTTPALTFTLSTAAANTAFGNFTGSTAAPAFGKLPLAAMATGTANTLIGYDGSGNPSGITVSTGLSLSGGVLTATGSGSIGGSIAATQVAFGTGANTIGGESPFTYNSTTNVLNSDTLTGHKFRGDSLKLNLAVQANRGFGGATKYFQAGNSIAFGTAATVFDSSFVACNGRLFQLPVVDSGVSGTRTPEISSMLLRNINYPNTFVTSIEGGYNNGRNTNVITNRPTLNNIVYSFKAAWWNQFAGPVQNATSGTGVTRTGTWTTGYTAINNAGGKTNGAAYTSSAGAYIEYVFTDSTVGALCEIPVATASSITVNIDGSTVQTLNPTGKFDGLGAYLSAPYGMFPIIVTGLSFGAHTLRITNVSGGLFLVDCFTNFVPANGPNSMALIFYDVPYQNAAGYASNPTYSQAAADSINSKIDSLAASLPSAWPLYVAKTNLRYDVTTGLSGDNIHPNNTGMKQWSLAAADAVNGTPPAAGVIFAQYNPDGSFNGFYAQSEKTGQKNKIAFTTSNGLQDVIVNNPTMVTDNVINGAAYKLSFSNFLRVIIDSTKMTAGAIVQNGAISAVGPAATIRAGNRGADTTQRGFEWYVSGNKMSFYDEFSNRNIASADTSLRFAFFTDPTEGNFNTPTAALHVGGNLQGRAAHAPLKLNFGVLMSTPEKGAFEPDSVGGGLWWTRKNGTRVRIDSPTVAGGGNPFADNTALVKNNADNTKLLILSAASISTATTRTATFPDANITVADKLSPLSQFASTTSAQLLGVISDETGTGSLVFGTSPTIATPLFTGLTSSGANDSVLTVDPTTGQLHRRSGTFNLTFYNGVHVAPTSDSVLWGGTLNQPTTISGAGFPVALGTSGSNLGGLSITGGKYNSAQGAQILGVASTINNAITAGSGNVTNFSAYAFLAPTITSTNTSVTYTTPSTLYIDNAPTLSTNSSATGRVYALNVNAGINHFGLGPANVTALFDGCVFVGNATITGNTLLGIGPSTATQTAVRFESGVDLTSPASGQMWWNGTNFYFGDAGGIKRDLLNGVHNYVHSIFTPTTGGTVNLINNNYNIINPAGALVALTVNLPSSPSNNDVVYIKYTQTISTVTYANGTVVDGITAPTAGGMVVLTYDSGTTSWY